jgi:arylsulfatase A-like enzyme
MNEPSTEPSQADSVPERYLQRVVRYAKLLGPAILVAWILSVAVLTLGVSGLNRWPSYLFAAGLAGTWLWLGVALASLALAAVDRWTPSWAKHPHPGLRRSVSYVLLAVAGTWTLSVVLEPVVERMLPRRLDLRFIYTTLGATGLAAAVSGAAVMAWHWIRRRGESFPLWIGAVVLVWVFVFRREAVFVGFQGRELPLLLVTLVGFTGFCLQAHRLLASRGPRLVAAGVSTLLVASILFTLAFAGTYSASRAELLARVAGAGDSFEMLYTIFDLDSDGYAGVLGGSDCDDSNDRVHPGMLEIVGDGVDNNCMGGDLVDVSVRERPDSTDPARRRSVVLITVDALRSDALNLDDEFPASPMPNLVKFGRETATLFSKAYAPAPYTESSMLSLHSGHLPANFRLGQLLMTLEPTLAEVFSEAGYATVALQQIGVYKPLLVQGFQTVDDELSAANLVFQGVTSQQMTDKAIKYYKHLRESDEPFFLWVHYFDPHSDYMYHDGTPFSDPDSLPGRSATQRRYLQEVWHTDRHLGRLFDALLGDDFVDRGGIIALTSDHGELLGDQERIGHGLWMDEGVLRVPLALAANDIPSGLNPTRVSLVDLFPTVTQLAIGQTLPSNGEELFPVMAGRETADRDVFAQSHFQGDNKWVGLSGDWKMVLDVHTGTEALYQVVKDPDELNNLVEDHADVASKMRTLIGTRWDQTLNNVVIENKRDASSRGFVLDEVGRNNRIREAEMYCRFGREGACEQAAKLRAQTPADDER